MQSSSKHLRRPPNKTALGWHSYAFRQSDQLRRQSLQCSWTSSLELSADGPLTAGLVSDSEITTLWRFTNTLRWRHCNLVSGIKAQCDLSSRFNCVLEIVLTYLITYTTYEQRRYCCSGKSSAFGHLNSLSCKIWHNSILRNGCKCNINVRFFLLFLCCIRCVTNDNNTPSQGMVKTATRQNGDKPKRLQVQSKRINLLSSTMDPLVYF